MCRYIIEDLLGKHKIINDIVAFIGYVVITVIVAYPLILNIRTSTYLGQDVFMWISYFSWFEEAIFDLNVSPLYNSQIFYPTGEFILGSAVFELLLFTPITKLFGPIVAYNTALLSSFIFSGFGTYLLVKYLLKNNTSAFIAGIIFAFSPVHIYHAMGHLHIMSVQWIPFFVLYLFKMMKEKTYSATILCALFYTFSALSSWYFAVFLLIFSILYAIHIFIYDRILIWDKKLVPLSVIFISIVSLSIYPFLSNLLAMSSEDLAKPIGEFIIWSADLTGYIVPSLQSGVYSIFYGDFLRNVYSNYTGGEKIVFVGYTVLLLSSYAVIKIKHENVSFFARSAIIFLILSLGPLLQIFGNYSIFPYGENLRNIQLLELMQIKPFPLPFSLLYFLPFTSMTRVPSRYSVIVILCLAVLVGYAIREILSKYRANPTKQKFVSILIVIFILFEYVPIIVQPSPVKAPDLYYQLAQDNDLYTVLEMPTAGPYMEFLYYQSIHGKNLIGGYTSRQGNEYYNRVLPNIPILRDFRYIGNSKSKYPHLFSDILNQSNSEIGNTVLNYFNIKYIIIHSHLFSNSKVTTVNETKLLVETILGKVEPIYQDNQLIAYEVKQEPNPVAFLMLDNTWSHVQMIDGKPTRYINNEGNIKIVSPNQCEIKLMMLVGSFSTPRTLDIYINGEYLDSYYIDNIYGQNDAWKQINTPLINLTKGVTSVRLYSPEKSFISASGQVLSLSFTEISLVDFSHN